MLMFNLRCQLVLRISIYSVYKNTSQCKIPIVPEEGWFGRQPNIAHLAKKILRCVGFCLYILHFICEADYDHSQRISAGSSLRLLARLHSYRHLADQIGFFTITAQILTRSLANFYRQ